MKRWEQLFLEAEKSTDSKFHKAKNGDVMVKLFGIEGYWFFCKNDKQDFLNMFKDI